MKHKILLVLFLSFMACFTANAQKVTLQFRQVKLAKVFEAITQQTGLTVAYSRPTVDPDRVVSIEADKEELSDVLTQLLKGTNVTFEIGETKIYLKEKTVSDAPQQNGQLITISGKIIDEKGETIIGASVAVQGTTLGTITNVDGIYDIKVPDKSAILQFKYIGFASREEAVNSRKIINVVLQDAATQLEDVVVVGYGVQKKASVVAAITSVKPQQLQVGTTRSLSNDLAGNIGGIIAVQRSGEPGYDNSEFWIRGMSSFKGSNSPLVLVDGVERSLNNLDISEIESFSVLKDASASAVYGVRGANGVILITTKRGHSGKTNINVSVEHSITRPAKLPLSLIHI